MQQIDRLADLGPNTVIEIEQSILTVTGEDATTFLQGQLTVDVTNLDKQQVRRTGHCDPKGKSWSVNLITPYKGGILLTGDAVGIDATQAQFKKFGVFSNITVMNDTDRYRTFFVKGEQAEAAVMSLFPSLPSVPMTSTSNENGVCMRVDLPEQGLLILCLKEQADNLYQLLLNAKATFCSAEVYEALCIQAGVPSIGREEHIGQFVPQMINLQALNAIDFKKGCYMGQEVVARTRYLGRNKRAGYILKADRAIENINTMQLEKQLGDNWRSGGTILRAVSLGKESWLLAVLSNDTTPDDVFRLHENPDAQLIHCNLPYRLED